MELQYKLKIENPLTSQVEVKIQGKRPKKVSRLHFYIPAFCPSDLSLKNYSKNINGLLVTNKLGELLYFERISQNSWEILFEESEVTGSLEEFVIQYRVSCFGAPPFYSYIDVTSAYLIGASIFMGVEFFSKFNLTLEFPALWSKINTSLADISEKSEEFVFSAPDFESLISTPILIGCHETDGFKSKGGDHHLSFNMEVENLKPDIIKILSAIENLLGGHPCFKYHFIFDFYSSRHRQFGFLNSSFIQIDGKKLKAKNFYKSFLQKLVPCYLRSFENLKIGEDFSRETHSNFLWVQEGIERFLSPIILLKAKLITEKDFLEVFLKKIILYTEMSGKYYQDLSDSSFSNWQKSSKSNMKVNRDLKGFILFLFLYSNLSPDLVKGLTLKVYQNPDQIFQLIQDTEIFDKIETFALTTENLDFFSALKNIGLNWKISKERGAYLGGKGLGMKVKSVVLDGPLYKAGILPGDQILKIDKKKVKTKDFSEVERLLKPQRYYNFTIKRDLKILGFEVFVESRPEKMSALEVQYPQKFNKFLSAF